MQLDGSFNLFNIPVGKTFGVILTPLYYKTFQIVWPKQVVVLMLVRRNCSLIRLEKQISRMKGMANDKVRSLMYQV